MTICFFGCYSKLLSKLQLKNYLTKKVPKLITLQVIRNTVVKKIKIKSNKYQWRQKQAHTQTPFVTQDTFLSVIRIKNTHEPTHIQYKYHVTLCCCMFSFIVQILHFWVHHCHSGFAIRVNVIHQNPTIRERKH